MNLKDDRLILFFSFKFIKLFLILLGVWDFSLYNSKYFFVGCKFVVVFIYNIE